MIDLTQGGNEDLRLYGPSEGFNGKIGQTAAESTPAWPRPPSAPEGAPNVVVIVLDDLGFAQLGCYGGLGGRIQTPHIDRLAAEGLRYQNFHTTALCSPTRAALLTGRNHHSVGVALIMERATGYPGYNGRIPKDSAMLPAILRENGYNTMCVGKWHLTPDEHTTPAGPFDLWPLGQGFERFYGFLSGETSQWEPDLWEDNHPVEPPGRPEDGYHLSADLVDKATAWIATQKAVAPSKPFFLYLSFGAVHAPHHAPPEYIERYRGKFDAGWDVVRGETLARQKEIGIMPESAEVPPLNPGVKAWDALTDELRRLFARQMEVFAAFTTHTDEQIGRLMTFLDDSGIREDTLVVLLSDNGASAEGGQNGLLSQWSYFNLSPESIQDMLARVDEWGSPSTHPHYASGWAMAGNTPNRMYKAFVHEGGTRDSLIVSWPSHINDPGGIRTQFHHVVDVTPTILELTGVEMPGEAAGHAQKPLEGTSFAYTLADAGAATRKERQYFEMFGHRAIWADGWKAVALHWSRAVLQRLGHIDHELHDGDWDADRWELYRIDEDPSELHDLADQHPDKLKELVDLWWREAERFNVLPLDDSLLPRLIVRRPRTFEPRDVYSYRGRLRLNRSGSPDVRNRSHRITAEFEVPPGGATGVIVSNGGAEGGYTLCMLDERLHYVSNFLGRTHSVASGTKVVSPGTHTATVEFERTGQHAGRARLLLDGEQVGEVEVPRTNPVAYAVAEGLEIGSDTTSPVWPAYHSPFHFTGTIHRVTISLDGDTPPLTPEDAAAKHRADMLTQ